MQNSTVSRFGAPWGKVEMAAAKLRGPTLSVWVVLCAYADGAGLAWPSVSALAEKCGCSVRAVRYALRRLQALGALEVAAAPGYHRPATYRLVGVQEASWGQTVAGCKPLQVANGGRDGCKLTPSRVQTGVTHARGSTEIRPSETDQRTDHIAPAARSRLASEQVREGPTSPPPAPNPAPAGVFTGPGWDPPAGMTEKASERPVEAPERGGPRRRDGGGPSGRPGASEAHVAVVDAFTRAYVAAYGEKPTWGAKQGAMVRGLLAKHGVDVVLARLGRAFSGGHWWGVTTLEAFVRHFDELVPASTAPAERRPKWGPGSEAWEREKQEADERARIRREETQRMLDGRRNGGGSIIAAAVLANMRGGR